MNIQDFPILQIRIGDIHPHPRNKKIYSSSVNKGIDQMAESIDEVGIIHEPIVSRRFDTGELVMLSGHRRLQGLLASGKTLDDTVACRVITGLTELEESAILVNGNWPVRQKTKQEKIAETVEILRQWREAKKLTPEKRRLLFGGVPKTMNDCSRLANMSPSQLKKVNQTVLKIEKCPIPETRALATTAFYSGRYKEAATIIHNYWVTNDKKWSEKTENYKNRVYHKEGTRKENLEAKVKSQALEISALKEKIKELTKKLASYSRQSGPSSRS